MADAFYNAGKKALLDEIDLDADTIKIALVTSTYTPDIDAHTDFDDITNEVSGTGYTAGGATLTVSVTQDNTSDLAKVDATDVTWSTSTITARGAVVYKSTGVSSTSPLICYYDFGSDKTSTAGDFVVSFHTDGLFTLS